MLVSLNSKEGKAKYAECLLLGRGVQKNETKGEIILRDEITNGDNDFARILYINYIIQKCGGVSNLLEEKCPKCHGNGVLIRDENHFDRCHRCGGSGQSAYAKYRKEVEMSVRKIKSFYSSDLEYLLNLSLFFPKEIWPMSFRDVVASEFRKRLVKNAENGDKTAVICIYFFYFKPDEILKPEYDKLIAGYLYSFINQNMFSYEMFNRIKIGVIKAIKEREFSLIPPEWLYHDNNEEYLTINKENKKYWYNEIKSLYCFTDNSEVSYGPSNTTLYSYKPDYQNSIFLEAKSHYDFNNINYDNCWYVYHFVKKYVDGPNNNSRDEKYSYYNTYLKNLNNAANIWMKKAAEIGIQEAIEKYEYYLLHGEFYHREPFPTEQIEYRENHSKKYY